MLCWVRDYELTYRNVFWDLVAESENQKYRVCALIKRCFRPSWACNTLCKLIHVWLIDDEKQAFENNCLSVIHDRCLPDMQFSMENSPVLIGGYWELFPIEEWMCFPAFLMAISKPSTKDASLVLMKSNLKQFDGIYSRDTTIGY